MNHAKTSDTINRELLVKFYTFGFPNFSLLPNKILAESQGQYKFIMNQSRTELAKGGSNKKQYMAKYGEKII